MITTIEPIHQHYDGEKWSMWTILGRTNSWIVMELCLTTNISEALVDHTLRRYQAQSSSYDVVRYGVHQGYFLSHLAEGLQDQKSILPTEHVQLH